MNRNDFALQLIKRGFVTVDTELGKVYRHRGPGGVRLTNPQEVPGSVVNGYLAGNFNIDGEKKQIRLHRLIWIAAHGGIPEKMTIDHINGQKMDNRLKNLRLLTAEDNCSEAHRNGQYSYDRTIPRRKYREVAEAALLHGETHHTIARRYGVTRGRVTQIVREMRPQIGRES